MRYLQAILFCLLAACAGTDDNDFGSATKEWTSYRTSTRYFGAQDDASNSQCQTSQPTSTKCRFLKTFTAMYQPVFIITVDPGFDAATRAFILSNVNSVIGGWAGHEGMNITLDNADATAPPGFSVDTSPSHVGDIHFKPIDFPNPSPPTSNALSSYMQINWFNCGSDLTESTSLPGTWRACDNANVLWDQSDINAKAGGSTGAYSLQATAHALVVATGASGTRSDSGSFANAAWSSVTQARTKYLTTDEACMLVNFFDGPGDGIVLGNPGPLFSGNHQGC